MQQKNNEKKKVVGRPFKKGQSGNPNGRPKNKKMIPDILRIIGKERTTLNDKAREKITSLFQNINVDDIDNLEALQRVIWYDALILSDPWSRKHIMDRTEGRVPLKQIVQNIDVIDAIVNTIVELDLLHIPGITKEMQEQIIDELIGKIELFNEE